MYLMCINAMQVRKTVVHNRGLVQEGMLCPSLNISG